MGPSQVPHGVQSRDAEDNQGSCHRSLGSTAPDSDLGPFEPREERLREVVGPRERDMTSRGERSKGMIVSEVGSWI